jgi:hypothetical protein
VVVVVDWPVSCGLGCSRQSEHPLDHPGARLRDCVVGAVVAVVVVVTGGVVVKPSAFAPDRRGREPAMSSVRNTFRS